MFGKEKRPGSEKIETVIGPTASFVGTLQTESGLRIDGKCEGTVKASGNVIIGPNGKVMADIEAENVSVSGAVKGNVTAANRLEILSTGKVWGDIAVASLLIAEGGFFRGKSVMTGDGEPSPVGQAVGETSPEAGER